MSIVKRTIVFVTFLWIFVLLSFTGCGTMKPEPVRNVSMSKNLTKTRAEKFKACLIELSREGIRQDLLMELCEASYGSINAE